MNALIKDRLQALCQKVVIVLFFSLAFFVVELRGQCPMPANSPAGTLDTCFTKAGNGLSDYVLTLALQPDNKILVGGGFHFYNGIPRKLICRLNADGSLDSSFAPRGTGLDGDYVLTIALQPDNKILVLVQGIPRNLIYRLNSDGSLDNSFTATNKGFNNSVSSLAIQPDGKVLVGGVVYFLYWHNPKLYLPP